jgi:hypothetical protein
VESLSPVALMLLFSLAPLFVGWFLLGCFEDHAHVSHQTTEKRVEQFGQRLLSADANQEFVEFGSYDRKMG